MAEKPILFSTPMVKAILEGRKTHTRRIIKGMGNIWHYGHLLGDWGLSEEPYIKDGVLHWELQTDVDDSGVFKQNLPYQPGDILWVRETFSIAMESEDFVKGIKKTHYSYRADNFNWGNTKWRPSIHMPRSAARLFLKVTSVRVERLQDTTEEDAKAEGVEPITPGYADGRPSYLWAFRDLWRSTIKKQDIDRYGWEASPWVFVYEFERIGHYL